jgi:tetratricopeptide (TPR) repeat protein
MRFDHLRVLIIEDHAEMRASLRAMLIRFGAQNIDNVICGEDAIEALKIKPYDLILSDYELGRGKDGQQILEEVRFSGLIAASASYVLVTAAQTMEMVMGALEYQPDGYITKPITYDVVHSRLIKILRHKAHFSEINAAIDDHNLPLALQECDRMVMHQPKFATQAYRIKAKLLFNDHQYAAAESVYRQVVDAQGLAWAQLGLARCLHIRKDDATAIDLLQKLIATNDKYVECYDLLAHIYLTQDQPLQAQAILEQAIEQSPKAVLRQSELGQIALRNENMEAAIKASRKAVSLSKNSCHHTPQNYLTLAKSLQHQLINGSQRDKTLSANEIDSALKEIRKNFPEDQAAQFQATLTEGLTLHNQGKPDKAKKIIQEAQALHGNAADANTQHYLQQTLSTVGLAKPQAPAKITSPKTPQQIEIERVEMENINNKGVELFQQGQVSAALQLFETAASKDNAKISVILNTLQAMLVLMQQQTQVDLTEFENCYQYFSRLKNLQFDKDSLARQEKLQKIYAALNPPEHLSSIQVSATQGSQK